MGLTEYRRKRDFKRTPEPSGKRSKGGDHRRYVIHKHAATRLHYDLRLEHAGVLKSWAVPKGPSHDPAEKRLAVEVEDHPIDYGRFEGVIPEGQYGAGPVILWDRGSWYPEGDVDSALRKGSLTFRLEGEKLQGAWSLVRLKPRPGEGKRNWLLIKRSDEHVDPAYDVTAERPESVASGRSIEQVEDDAPPGQRRRTGRKTPTKAAAKPRAKRPARSGARRGRTRQRTDEDGSPSLHALLVDAGRKAPLPATASPQLALLVKSAPEGDDWLHEIKFDGYRVLARLDDGRVEWRTRTGLDWTPQFASLSGAVADLPCRRALLDGEVVVVKPDGSTSFQDLQAALGKARRGALTYFAFDLLHLDGYDLRDAPLRTRKAILKELLAQAEGAVRYSDHAEGNGAAFHEQACKAGLEGIVSKRADAPYRSGRSDAWRKVKCVLEQEFVVAGFTRPSGTRVGLGALVLGVHDQGRLVHVGKVGTGFDRETLLDLRRRLEGDIVADPPFDGSIAAKDRRGVTWVKPRLVAQVAFTGWTADGHLRHPTFRGLRHDKPAAEVVRELPADPPAQNGAPRSHAAATAKPRRKRSAGAPDRPAEATVQVAGVPLTHPDRVLYPGQGITKLELAQYYESMAPWILPHVADRPLSVVRCPQGAEQACFFQKHRRDMFPDAVKSVEVSESQGKAHYLMVDSVAGLVALVQMGVLELHPWGSRRDRLEQPDVMFFDLDPGPGVAWEAVTETALLMRGLLDHMGLAAFVKTTGGKGLHVVVPLQRRHSWDEVKEFSRSVVLQLVHAQPDLFVATASKQQRKDRIFLDYLRNGRGATAVAAYSTRARPGAPISTPVSWDEVAEGVASDAFTVRNIAQRLGREFQDPWHDFFKVQQSLSAKARRLAGL